MKLSPALRTGWNISRCCKQAFGSLLNGGIHLETMERVCCGKPLPVGTTVVRRWFFEANGSFHYPYIDQIISTGRLQIRYTQSFELRSKLDVSIVTKRRCSTVRCDSSWFAILEWTVDDSTK